MPFYLPSAKSAHSKIYIKRGHTQFIVTIQDPQNLLPLLNRLVTIHKHTIDIKRKRHVLHGLHLILGELLHPGGQHLPPKGGLRSRRPRDSRGARDGQRRAERVARAAALLHGRIETQVVHEGLGLADGVATGRDFDHLVGIAGDGGASISVAEFVLLSHCELYVRGMYGEGLNRV